MTLENLFESAKQNTPTLQNQILDEQIANEKKSQAIGEVLPKLSVEVTDLWRDKADVGAFGEQHQRTSYLSLTQPIFQGGAEYYGISIAKKLPEIARLEKLNREITLYFEVAEAFFELLSLQKEMETLSQQENALDSRVQTLKSRARIGRNKQTDVISAMSQAARLKATMAQLESQVVLAKQKLKSVTGIEILTPLSFTKVYSFEVPSSWQQELHNSPKLKAQKLVLENAMKEESVAKGSYWPNLDLDGKYYLKRDGILKDSDWDLTLNAKWEFFSGGSDSSEVRIARLEAQKIKNDYEYLKKTLFDEFTSLKLNLDNKRDTLKKLQQAVELAQKNYLLHVKEADRGLVSQLDLLRAQEDYLQIKRTHDQELYSSHLIWIQLRSLAGVVP